MKLNVTKSYNDTNLEKLKENMLQTTYVGLGLRHHDNFARIKTNLKEQHETRRLTRRNRN